MLSTAHPHSNSFTAYILVSIHKCSVSVPMSVCYCSPFLAKKGEEKLWSCSCIKHLERIEKEPVAPSQGRRSWRWTSYNLAAHSSDSPAASKARQVAVEELSRKYALFCEDIQFFSVKMLIVTISFSYFPFLMADGDSCTLQLWSSTTLVDWQMALEDLACTLVSLQPTNPTKNEVEK